MSVPPPGPNRAGYVVTLVIILIGVVMAGGLVILLIRRRLFANDASHNQASAMDSIRAMRDSGQISTEEYDTMRKRMVEKIKGNTPSARIVPALQLPAAPTRATDPAASEPPNAAPVPAIPATPSPSPAAPVPGVLARPGFDLTGQPLPFPRLAPWQWLLSVLALLLALGVAADLIISLGVGSRGVMWTTGLVVQTFGAKAQILQLSLVLAAGLVVILGALTLTRRREPLELPMCALLFAGATILPILGHLSMALSIPAGIREGDIARVALSRCMTEAIVACAMMFLACVLLWVARRRTPDE